VQLKTKSKMFCRCDNRDDQPPNTAICPICTGQPGTLPLPNRQAIDWAVMTSLALGCKINQSSKFDRKNYFYPDLPKGYQISQYDQPFGYQGKLEVLVDDKLKTFRIHRLHLEEDAGKLIHQGDTSLVDLNRVGTPLMEVVSEPDFQTPAEAKAYLQELQLIARYLGVSDADMEKGHLRCDANISLRLKGEKKLYPKTEVKNINSFRAVERALQYEIERQTGLWEDGHPPKISATRGWNDAAGQTHEQRTKEGEADYRYFPEPDIPPIIISDKRLDEIKQAIPELPAQRRQRYEKMYGLPAQTTQALVVDRDLAKYFEEVVTEFRAYIEAELSAAKAETLWKKERPAACQTIANWLINRIPMEHRLTHGLPPAADLARLLWMVHQKQLTLQAAIQVYDQMLDTKKGPHQLVKELGLEQVSDTAVIDAVVQKAIKDNPKVVAEVKAGKSNALQFLVGQVMKVTKGKANPQLVQSILKKSLDK